jgi:hypothetical protein
MKNLEKIAEEIALIADTLLLAEQLEADEKQAEVITGELHPSVKKDTLMFWAGKDDCADLHLAINKAKLKGKAGGVNFGKLVVDAHKGNGAVFFIDADSKGEALKQMENILPHRKYRNVYYWGPSAAASIGM